MGDELNGKKVTVEEGEKEGGTAFNKLMDVMMKRTGLTMKEYDRVRDMVLEAGHTSASVRASLKVGSDVAEANTNRKLDEMEFGLLMESYVSCVTITLLVMLRKGMICEEDTCPLREKIASTLTQEQYDLLKADDHDTGNTN
jgi:hypothetical protein